MREVEKMKAVAFNCSPRKDGNTAHMLRAVLEVLESEGIETELVQVGGKLLHGCTGCGSCRKTGDLKCILPDDGMNEMAAKMTSADGVIIGSPTYYSDLTTEAKALIDRVGYMNGGAGNLLRRKVAASVSPARRAGAVHVLDSINHFFMINEMVVVSSSYWNVSLARLPDDYEKDAEGIRTMQNLGSNMAWVMKKLEK